MQRVKAGEGGGENFELDMATVTHNRVLVKRPPQGFLHPFLFYFFIIYFLHGSDEYMVLNMGLGRQLVLYAQSTTKVTPG